MGEKGDDIISRMLAAMSTYDAEGIRGLCTPDLRRWLSVTEQESDLDELVATIRQERDVVADAVFQEQRRIATTDGAVVMLTVDGTTKKGGSFHIPVCLVMTVVGDRVSRIDEYANLERARPLISEMFG